MSSIYYKKRVFPLSGKRITQFFGFFLIIGGLGIVGYIFLPLILWQLTIAPVFASQNIASPIPNSTFSVVQSLVATSMQNLQGTNYDDVSNWFPGYAPQQAAVPVDSYTLSIPKLRIKNAVVSTIDNNLAQHLVHFGGTALPPNKGTGVIFGHSTIEQWFDPTNYKTIFATLYHLQVGDQIIVTIGNITYTYTVTSLTVVNPDDTSILAQDYSDSFIAIVTCTPDGTTWQRLIVKARLQKL
ncbi:MAG TPA: sortase [Patescibacteria group bacterium]|nr:sortase [Patescibacteria group bacterium]